MARKIDVRRIFEKKNKGTSNNAIVSDWSSSKYSIIDVVTRAMKLGISQNRPSQDKTDDALYRCIALYFKTGGIIQPSTSVSGFHLCA